MNSPKIDCVMHISWLSNSLIIVLCVFVFGNFPLAMQAQTHDNSITPFRFQHYNSSDGLSPYIGGNHRMIQDQYGFIWTTSLNGLNRFDGREFKIFRNNLDRSSVLSGNNVLSVLEDEEGKIWIGTVGGLNIYDPITDTWSSGPNMNYQRAFCACELTRFM